MRQKSFTAEDFEKYRKKTRKEVFLEEMNQIIPWQDSYAWNLVKAGNASLGTAKPVSLLVKPSKLIRVDDEMLIDQSCPKQ